MTAISWLRARLFRSPKKAGASTLSIRPRQGGFTLIEVVVAAGLVVFGLSAVYAMQAHTVQITRAARDSSSASQVLQQRVEQLRMSPFATITSPSGVVGLMQGSAGATKSEREMKGVRNLRETVVISTYARPGVSPAPAVRTFSVARSANAATTTGSATSLSTESQVKARLLVTWDDRAGTHRREFTTVLSKGGLSLAGISAKPERSTTPVTGGATGGGGGLPPVVPPVVPPVPATPVPATPVPATPVPATPVPATPVPATPVPATPVPATPVPLPSVCKHGRTWPHCGQR